MDVCPYDDQAAIKPVPILLMYMQSVKALAHEVVYNCVFGTQSDIMFSLYFQVLTWVHDGHCLDNTPELASFLGKLCWLVTAICKHTAAIVRCLVINFLYMLPQVP